MLAGTIAGAGCTVLTNDGLPDDAGKFEGGGDAASPVCATCLADQCTGAWAACLTDPACAAIFQCGHPSIACDETCRSACVCAAPSSDAGAADAAAGDAGTIDPRALYRAFASCNDARTRAGAACSNDCGGASSSNVAACSDEDAGGADSGATDAGDAGDASDDAAAADAGDGGLDASVIDGRAGDGGDAGTTAPATGADACASCVSNECGDPKKACAIGSECAAYLECAYAAASAAAADECGRQHATGKTAAVELATCTRVGCSDACGF